MQRGVAEFRGLVLGREPPLGSLREQRAVEYL